MQDMQPTMTQVKYLWIYNQKYQCNKFDMIMHMIII